MIVPILFWIYTTGYVVAGGYAPAGMSAIAVIRLLLCAGVTPFKGFAVA